MNKNDKNKTSEMNGKPVYTLPSTTVLNMNSGFAHKGLCDGPTFSPGSACAYTCSFCYVEAALHKNAPIRKLLGATGLGFQDVVIRRQKPVDLLRKQLTYSDGSLRYNDPHDHRVVYASPLVDIAANIELTKEAAEMCLLILELTNWQIRLLSKSPLITRIADAIPSHWAQRMIYGLSTGTLDDAVAQAIEIGTPLVRRRVAALHELQDRGLRTYGMVCPILPQQDPEDYARQAAEALRVDRCEHVWAEVLNVRGQSMTKTCDGLIGAGCTAQAQLLEKVSIDREVWEDYARNTFLALTKVIPAGKLRFLQYVRKDTLGWWEAHQQQGAVVLGKASRKDPKA